MDDITLASASSLADSIRNKTVSCEEVVRAHLDRIEAVNPMLNAVVQLRAEAALAEARAADTSVARGEQLGPLHGVPMTIKDSIDTQGVITTGGTQGRASFVPAKDATVVARLRQAGAILMGKTNTPELTLAGETDNLVYGRTNNPFDPQLTPGGSSGGAAAIVASAGSPFDLGSDTGGSIRQPAHYCGIVGCKPTTGRVPSTGHIASYDLGVVSEFTQIGPLARSVEDVRLILPIIAGPDWRDPSVVDMPLGDADAVNLAKLRGAFYTDNRIVTPTPEIAQAVRHAVDLLTEAGVSLQEDLPEPAATTGDLWRDLLVADGGAWIRRMLDEAGTTQTHPLLVDRFLKSDQVTAAEYTAMLSEVARVRSTMLGFIASYDFIICPTNAFAAQPHGQHAARGDGYSYTRIYNLTGWPAIVIRGGTSPEGLPFGLQIVARPWREDVAFAVAAHLEKALGEWPGAWQGPVGQPALKAHL